MKKILLLAFPALLFACSPNGEEELVTPQATSKSLVVSSNAVYDSVVYVHDPQGVTVYYKRVADTTFTDPVTQEVVPGISYVVLVYDSVQLKSPSEGRVKFVSFKRPSGKPALNLSSKYAPDNVYFVRKDNDPAKYPYSYLRYYNRSPQDPIQPMVCRFVVGKYAADTDQRYASIANWDLTTVNITQENSNNTWLFRIFNPFGPLGK